MLKLHFRDRRREAVWLVDQTFTIGKHPRNSLMIDDAQLHDFHAEIVNQNDTLTINNKADGTGVWVNGIPVSDQTPLKAGDKITLASLELELIDPKSSTHMVPQGERQASNENWSIVSSASWLEQNRFNLSGKITIGRDPSCDITLPLDHLSRKHVELELSGGQLHIRDLDSSNGTYVNGEKISQAILKTGDKIKLDVVTFTVNGPTHDPNKTIIRSVPTSQPKATPSSKSTNKSAEKVRESAGSAAQTATKVQKKKLAANRKQDWISDSQATPEDKKGNSILPMVIGLVVVAAGVGAFFVLKG